MTIRYTCPVCRTTVQDLHYTREELPPESIACPKCGTRSPREVIGSPTIIFKGSGWTSKGKR